MPCGTQDLSYPMRDSFYIYIMYLLVFTAACGPSLIVESRGYSSFWRLLLFQSTGSGCRLQQF